MTDRRGFLKLLPSGMVATFMLPAALKNTRPQRTEIRKTKREHLVKAWERYGPRLDSASLVWEEAKRLAQGRWR